MMLLEEPIIFWKIINTIKMGELDKALEYREKGLEIMEKALGPDHADALMIKEKIAALRHRLQS